MKNVTLFLCDIHGTYIKNNELVSRQEIEKLLENLEKLRIINNSEKIIFSFVSTESENIVKKEITNLQLNNNYENVEFGFQFFEDGYFNNAEIVYDKPCGKISQILSYLKKIQMNYKIDKIYYADDTEIYHFMLDGLLMELLLEDKLQSIIPKNTYGLEELNSMIDEIMNSKIYTINKQKNLF